MIADRDTKPENMLLGSRVFVWPKAFTPAECAGLAARFTWDKHGVRDLPPLAHELGLMIGSRMHGCFPLQWGNEVTFSIQRVPWHLDSPMGATHKLCLYLDPGPGTEFRDGTAVGGQGSIALFDMKLEHRTEPGAEGVRRVLGLRAKRIR